MANTRHSTIEHSVTATGSTTARPSADWHADVINAKAFAARGDGSTNDATSVAAALTAAGNARSIFFPKGNYIIDGATLNLNGTTNLIGDGRENTYLTIRNNTGAGLQINSGAGVTTHGWTVSDMTIRAGSGATDGVYIGNPGGASPVSAGGRFERVTVSGFTGKGIVLKTAQLLDCYDTWISSCGRGLSSEGSTNENDHVTFYGGRIRSNAIGVYLQQFDTFAFYRTNIETNTQEAILTDRPDSAYTFARNLLLDGCWIEQNNTSRTPGITQAQVKFTAGGTRTIDNTVIRACRFAGQSIAGEKHIYFGRGDYVLDDNWFDLPDANCLIAPDSSLVFIRGRSTKLYSGPAALWQPDGPASYVTLLWEHVGPTTGVSVYPYAYSLWANNGKGALEKVFEIGPGDANQAVGSRVTRLGFFGATPTGKAAITGSRANTEEALRNLLTQLAALGLVTDSTTA